MSIITVQSHISPNMVHGGYEDAAGLTLWLEESGQIAHLVAHSGDSIPLNGPMPHNDHMSWEVWGKSGMITIFTPDEITDLCNDLEEIFEKELLIAWDERINERLHEVDLEEMSYREWTFENERETYQELYAS